jgi:hydroxymethylbilane synthase
LPILQQREGLPADVMLRFRQQGQRRSNGLPLRRFLLRRLFGFQLCGLRTLTMKQRVKIGTRGSQLALWQANWIRAALMDKAANLDVELVTIKTRGDRILDIPLAQVGGKALFVKEIEEALLDGRVDLAVHSMKDMPSDLPEGLTLGPIPKREDPHDVLISRNGRTFSQLPDGARIGTCSLRRGAQLKHWRPDLEIVPLRGNLDTRLRKLYDDEQELEAIVLASAGLRRLRLTGHITETFDPAVMLPAVGQGALCIEIRRNDDETARVLAQLEHPATRTTVLGERAFLHRLEGGCQVPIAAHGRLRENEYVLEGLVADLDGSTLIRDSLSGPAREAESIGIRLAERLLARGADRILEALNHETS